MSFYCKPHQDLKQPMSLPDYTLKESSRAKHVRLKISAQEGLVIVVPQGFDRRRLPEILQRRRTWIEKHLAALQDLPIAEFPPAQLELLAVDEVWQIKYLKQAKAKQVLLEENELKRQLLFKGDIDNEALIKQGLHQWLLKQGRQHFVPWLQQLSHSAGLHYNKLQVRKQKTRWGSCSSRLTISLNYKLLFLPPQFARYVLLHELAHTRYLNHSKAFWALLEELEKDCLALDNALDAVGKECVPTWL